MLSKNVKIGIGVDGSASNDGSHMLNEVRQAMLISRLRAGLEGASLSGEGNSPLMTARQALELGTIGSASVLGRTDIGSLAAGKCADFIAVDINQLNYAGALHDPLAALVLCSSINVNYNVVGGKFIVKEGNFLPLELNTLIENHNSASIALLND